MKSSRGMKIALSGLLLMGAAVAPRPARSQKFKLTNTSLDVRRTDDPAQSWGNSVVINTPQAVAFRWKTTDQGVRKAVWQLSEENLGLEPFPKGVIASGAAGNSLFYQTGHFQDFLIDLKTLPTYVPQTPPATPRVYWVRVLPQDNSGQFTGTIPVSVKVTYKGSTDITGISETPHGTYAELAFTTMTPTIPIVEASTKAPGAGPAFGAGDVQSSALPLLAGYRKDHRVRLDNLRPGVRYYYVIRVKDQKGNVARKTSYFATLKRRLTLVFQEIYIKDDSDELSEGDLEFGFYLDGQLLFSPRVGLDTGQRLPLQASHFTASRLGPAEPFVVRVVGLDDDDTEWPLTGQAFQLGTNLQRYEALKSAFPGDAAEGSRSFTYRTGPDEAFSQSFTLKTDPAKLKFEVKATFTVTYQ